MYRLTRKLTQIGATDLQDLNYSYDAAGNVTAIQDNSDTDTAKTATFGYDDLYRLTSATVTNAVNGANYTRTYAYDIIGNITNRSDVGAYTYAGNVAATASATVATPHAVTQAGGMAYSYDANGNVLSDGTWTHSWDYQDRMTSSADTTTTLHYSYDEARKRVLKHNATTGEKTYYVDRYYDLNGSQGKAHIFAGSTKVATHLTDTTQ